MIVVYDVLYGPIWCEDIPDWDFEEDGEAFVLVCKVWDEDSNQLIDEEILCETLDEALDMVDHFKVQKKPFLILDDEEAGGSLH